ncbi:MAG: MAPEG family protein [Paracoccaceae bacterium]
MTIPLIAALYAGLNAFILIWLTFAVIRRRGAKRVSLGSGGDAELEKAVRSHANAAETMPMALILLALTELIGAPGVVVHIAGAALAAGRLLHGLHFNGYGPMLFRMIGMAATLMVMFFLALGLVAHALVGIF